jgi:hypothetical protein
MKSRKIRWEAYVARMRKEMNAYTILVGKPEGKRPLGRPRRRWGTITKWTLEIGWCGTDSIDLAQDGD